MKLRNYTMHRLQMHKTTNLIGSKIKDYCKNEEEIVRLLAVVAVGDLREVLLVNLLTANPDFPLKVHRKSLLQSDQIPCHGGETSQDKKICPRCRITQQVSMKNLKTYWPRLNHLFQVKTKLFIVIITNSFGLTLQ